MRNNSFGRHLTATLSCVLGIGLTAPAVDAAVISVGSASIPQGTSFVIIPVSLSLSAGEAISSMSIGFGVGDGGPAVGNASGTMVPISEVTVPANSIFTSPEFSYSFNPGTLPASSATVVNIGITDQGESTSASGTVVNVKLDTSGVAGGQYVLNANFDNSSSVSNLGDAVTFSSTNGTLTVVPEPSFLGLAAASLTMLMAVRRRT
ncbi:MAG: hypothetical protein H7144_12945 [Burkholderiales bacterium]|nr:hypothetical protein [Phycisphaerae bacterium]